MTVHPYLNFPGNTEEVFNFYKSVFGGEFTVLQRFKDIPGDNPTPPALGNLIMHVSLPLAPGYILMGTDAPAEMGFKLTFGNNCHISISPDTREETERIFNALSAGGKVEMPLQDMFWGAYFGSFADKYGVQWMINHENKK